MITTVCLNPSFDKTASVDQLQTGQVNRLKNVRYDVGGKGINVAIVLSRLGVPVQCVGCLGDLSEEMFLNMIREDGIPFEYLRLPGKVRTNLKLMDESEKCITELNDPGLEMTPADIYTFLDLLRLKAEDSEYVVVSGSLPIGCHTDMYQQCLKVLPEHKCILDAGGEALLCGIREKPYLIKPNLHEMESLMKKELHTLRSLKDAASLLMKYGAQNVAISMGKYGAVLITQKGAWFAPSIPVEAHSTVGAGDAMIGGILAGINSGCELQEAFRWGVAAGAACVMTEGTQLIRKCDFDQLIGKVVMQEI